MLTLLLAGSLAVSAPVPKVKLPPDPERMLGAWEVYDDEKAIGTGSTTVWTFTDGKMHSNNVDTDWAVKLDTDQSPKHFDLTQVGGTTRYTDIYEFDGEWLRVAFTGVGERPAGFTPGRVVYVHVLLRAKGQPGK